MDPAYRFPSNGTPFDLFFESVPGAHAVVLADDPAYTVVAASDDYLKGAGLARTARSGLWRGATRDTAE